MWHLVPFTTLLSIYRSLILPYLSYGLAAWGQAAKSHLQKILVLQKRVLRLMYFSEPRANAVLLFSSSQILPLNMLRIRWNSFLIVFDVSCLTVPTNISNLFIKANEKHNHETRFSAPPAIFILTDRDWIKTMVLLLGSELSFGTPFAMNFVTSPRELSKNISMTCYFRY